MRKLGANKAQRAVSAGKNLVLKLSSGSNILQMYHDALCTLDNNVAASMVSPSLMGSCGVIPLTVISVYVWPLADSNHIYQYLSS
jgi:hypothetical protein